MSLPLEIWPPLGLRTTLFSLKTLLETPVLAPAVLCRAAPFVEKKESNTVTTDPEPDRLLRPIPMELAKIAEL